MAKARMQDPFPEVQRLEKNLGLHGNNLRLLKHLASLSYPVNQAARRSALEVAEEMGWPVENVSAYVERLQKDLSRCYSMQSNPLHIVVHPGGRGPTRTGDNYLVELVDAVDHSATRRFWSPHLGHGAGPVVLTTNAPLFFHHVDDGYRVRVMGVNTTDELSRHRNGNDKPDLTGCVECFHYLSAGDFRICMALTKLFTREGADIDPRIVIGVDLTLNDHYNPADSVDLANTRSLIAIGNPRVSWVVNVVQDELKPNFYLERGNTHLVRNREPQPGEEPEYKDVLDWGGHLFAVVVRHSVLARTQTLILAQNGPAFETIGNLLTDEKSLSEMLADKRWGGKLPANFECLFRVPLGKREVAKRDSVPELIAVRTDQQTHLRSP